jgi:DNA-directed RNA polymerase specialized sigma24 family protein
VDLAEDATQQALLAIWQNLPMLRDPARFEAWSYRLLVHACYDEGRRRRVWKPNLRVLHDDREVAPDALGNVHDRDQLERGFRPAVDRPSRGACAARRHERNGGGRG